MKLEALKKYRSKTNPKVEHMMPLERGDYGWFVIYKSCDGLWWTGHVEPGTDWLPYEEPKPKVLKAPAFIHFGKDGIQISGLIYGSEQEAMKSHPDNFHSWPAIPNAQGFYEVPE